MRHHSHPAQTRAYTTPHTAVVHWSTRNSGRPSLQPQIRSTLVRFTTTRTYFSHQFLPPPSADPGPTHGGGIAPVSNYWRPDSQTRVELVTCDQWGYARRMLGFLLKYDAGIAPPTANRVRGTSGTPATDSRVPRTVVRAEWFAHVYLYAMRSPKDNLRTSNSAAAEQRQSPP
jgi:hypothetical protein